MASFSHATDQDTGKIPVALPVGNQDDAAEEVVVAPEHEMSPCQHVTEQKEFLDGILKYLCQIDASLRKAFPTEKMETEKLEDSGGDSELEGTPVDSELLEKFFDAVRVWDTEKMISMIDREPRLMLEISKWGDKTECTVFQLAVLLNSEETVANMLSIAIREFGPIPQHLFDVFKGDGFELNAVEIASVWGNERILEMLKKAEKGRPIDFNEIEYSPELAEKQDILVRLRPILNSDLEAVVRGDFVAQGFLAEIRNSERRVTRDSDVSSVIGTSSAPNSLPQNLLDQAMVNYLLMIDASSCLPNVKGTIREMLISVGDYGWGAPYGLSFRDEDDLFVLHSIAKFALDTSSWPNFIRSWPYSKQVISLFMAVLRKICEVLGPRYTTFLMTLRDHHGRAPMHVLSSMESQPERPSFNYMTSFLTVMEKCCDPGFDIFKVRDLAGRTCLHHAVAVAIATGWTNALEALNEFGGHRIGGALAVRSDKGTTVMDLAVMHNHIESVKILAKYPYGLIQSSQRVQIVVEGPNFRSRMEYLGPFQMAAMEGQVQILQTFLQEDNIQDSGLINWNRDGGLQRIPGIDTTKFLNTPALHLAAHSGNPLAVKTLLESGKFNVFAVDQHGNTALHSVAGSKLRKLYDSRLQAVDFVDPRAYYDAKLRDPSPSDPSVEKRSLGGIIGCMELLVQEDIDMDLQNIRGETPLLIPSASDDLARWWYDKLVESKKNLVDAANAVSVIAALVATASFVGPLQPPLGLSSSTETWLTGYSQVNHTAVQVFLFCDSLSFYVAIASIMLAIIPSLTIQSNALPLEVRIAKRVVQWAVILLLASIMFVICAFSAASIAIVPESRWRYKALAVVSIVVGAFVCLIALCLFFLRLAGLIRPNHYWANSVSSLTNYIFSKRRDQKKGVPSRDKYEDKYDDKFEDKFEEQEMDVFGSLWLESREREQSIHPDM